MSNIVQPLPTLQQVVEQVQAERKAAAAPAQTKDSPVVTTTKVETQAPVSGTKAPETKTAAIEAVVEAAQEQPTASGTEAPVEEAPAKKDPVSSQFAAMARKEREARAKAQELQARERAIAERERQMQADLDAKLAELKANEERWSNVKKSPLKALRELGLTYQDLTQDALGNYKEPEVDPVDQKLSPLQKEQQELAKKYEEINAKLAALDQREAQQAIREVMDTIEETAQDEKYEYIRTNGNTGYELVKDVMAEYYAANQKLLTYTEACDIVEQYYENEVVKPLLSTKKVKSRVNPSQPAKTTPTKPSPSKEAKGPTTLTNAHATAPNATIDIDKLSKQDAISMLSSKLRFHE